MEFPEVIGYNARVDHAGYDALFTPNEINLYTLYKVTQQPDITPDQIWSDWAVKNYGEKAAPEIINALQPTFDIVNKLFFPQGVWFTNHSKLPPYNYAFNHIRFINKWYDDAYLEITRSLENPDLQTYQELVLEKDTAIALIQQCLWALNAAEPHLKEEDFRDLNERLILLLQTGLIWRAHTEAFFGFLLLDQNPGYLPIVERAVEQILDIASKIPAEQEDKPVADKKTIIKIAKEIQDKLGVYTQQH